MARKPAVPLKPTPTDIDRFRTFYEEGSAEECWLWLGCKHNGYGAFWLHGNLRPAHRVSYVIAHGDISDPLLVLDHLCRNRACITPNHLEPVTGGENVLRSELTPSGANLRKTTCPKGHEYDMFGKNPKRRCRTCHREADRRYAARKRAAA